MRVSNLSHAIAGGIGVSGETIVCGGNSIVVGENTKWSMRNKFLKLKHLSKAPVDEKRLLKIVCLKLPISFSKQLVYYDDGKRMPLKTDKILNNEKYSKALSVLKCRLENPIDEIVNRLITEYNLRAPLYWVLSDIIKFLARINKKTRPNARKIKISPKMSVLVKKVWNNKSPFKYVVNSDEIPHDLMDLLLHMLSVIKKTRPPKGYWSDPLLEDIKYPILPKKERIALNESISKLKKKLKKKITSDKSIHSINEYILTIPKIEHLLVPHINNIEVYYIQQAHNMKKILNCIKLFFKK